MRITDLIVKHIPNHNFNGGKTEKVIKWFGENISTTENRLLIGVSALMSQPFIDLYNKDVDEKTRVVSCARTIAKTISGTAIGVAVRGGLVLLTKKYSELGEATRSKKFFTPKSAPHKMTYAFKQYQNAMGMFLAVGALLVTNFLIDAPLTAVLTNLLNKKFENAGKKENITGGEK